MSPFWCVRPMLNHLSLEVRFRDLYGSAVVFSLSPFFGIITTCATFHCSDNTIYSQFNELNTTIINGNVDTVNSYNNFPVKRSNPGLILKNI